MKVYTFPQGSEEWARARMGLPTASEFHHIVAPSTGKLSTSRDKKGEPAAKVLKHAFRLVAETLTRRSYGPDLERLEHIMRGKAEEPNALARFAEVYEVRVQMVGLLTSDDGRWGASPDGLICPRLITEWRSGDPVITVEAKAPDAPAMVGYIYEGFGDDYIPQAMGQCLVAEAERTVRYAYNPGFVSVCDDRPRDDAYCDNLRQALEAFCDIRDAVMEKIKAHGFFIASEAPTMTALDQMVASMEGELVRASTIAGVDAWSAEHAANLGYLDAEQRERLMGIAALKKETMAGSTL